MAKYAAVKNNWTPTAVADTTNMTAGGFMAVKGGATSQRNIISEIYMGGLAASSAPAQMIVARDSTVMVGATSNAVKLTLIADPNAEVPTNVPLAQDVGSSTLPQRSSSLYLLALAFNAFGGIVRWVAAPGQELGMVGSAANVGEVSLSSASTGTPGLMSSHFIFETV